MPRKSFAGTHSQHVAEARKHTKDERRFLSWAREEMSAGKCQAALANLLAASKMEGRVAISRAGAGRRASPGRAIRQAERRFVKACLAKRG